MSYGVIVNLEIECEQRKHGCFNYDIELGSMAELVDAPDSKSGHQCAWGLIKAKHTQKNYSLKNNSFHKDTRTTLSTFRKWEIWRRLEDENSSLKFRILAKLDAKDLEL